MLLALTGCSVTPTAVPAADGYTPFLPAPVSESVTILDDFEASPQETHDYWDDPSMFENVTAVQFTPPDERLTGGDPATGAYVPPTVPLDVGESPNGYGLVTQAQVYDRNGLGAGTFGRLYSKYSDGNFVCSATVVNSKTGSVVATAAHCIIRADLGGEVAESVIFVPGDRDRGAEQPYGKWAATQFFAPQEFIDNAKIDENGAVYGQGWTHDFAFLAMEEQGGKTIQEAVGGGQGIAFGVPVTNITQIGYPSADPFDGSEQYMCASTGWVPGMLTGYGHECSMTPGGSGGAWLGFYDRNLGAGYVIATSSIVTFASPRQWSAPALGQTAYSLYQQAGGY